MDESAASETVGVILMAAITVILAAIIAVYVFGLITNMPINKNIMISVEKPTLSTITVTYRGGLDQKDLNSLRIIWPQSTPEIYPDPKVGEIYPRTGSKTITPGVLNHIVVVGYFTDNKEQVLINAYV